MYSLPISTKVGDNEFKIRNKGDYRMVLDCFSALNDGELEEEERVISSLIIFYENINSLSDLYSLNDSVKTELIKFMFNFMSCGEPQSPKQSNEKLIDWETDSTMICAAINNVCHYEIRAVEYCHWWTFMGYYMSVGESTLSNVVSIRHKLVTGKKLEKYEKDFKKDNPQYFSWDRRTIKEKQADELIRSWFK